MKLATYEDGSRDGQLVVVARDLSQAHYATGIASRLQQVLDDWNFLAPQLVDLYTELNAGRAPHAFPFEPERCMAPLPRACQWVAGAAYLRHVELAHRARGAELPPGWQSEPLLRQGASDGFLGPCDDVVVPREELGIDFGAQLAAVTGDVRRGAAPEQALEGVRLLALANDVSLRHLAQAEQARGWGLLQSQPATAFGPVAVTPDELGEAWQDGRVHLTLQCTWNGRRVGMCEAGPEMAFSFGQLIAHLARTRHVRAGSIVGSGPVANQDAAKGYACIADRRGMDILDHGQPATAFMRFGDTIRIEMKNRAGQSVFGAIEQAIAPPQ